jgi:hypothetical protein
VVREIVLYCQQLVTEVYNLVRIQRITALEIIALVWNYMIREKRVITDKIEVKGIEVRITYMR